MLTNEQITEYLKDDLKNMYTTYTTNKDIPEIKLEHRLADLGIVNNYEIRRVLKNTFTYDENDKTSVSGSLELTRRECDELLGTETVGQLIDKAIALYPKVFARREDYSDEGDWRTWIDYQMRIKTPGKDKLTNEDITYIVMILIAKHTGSSYDTYAIELNDHLKDKGRCFQYGNFNLAENLIAIFLNDDEIKAVDKEKLREIGYPEKNPNLYLLTEEDTGKEEGPRGIVDDYSDLRIGVITVGDFIKKVQALYPKVAARAKSSNA